MDDRAGLIDPKDREPRVVYLTPHARKVLDEWIKVVGAKDSARSSRLRRRPARSTRLATPLRGGDGGRGMPEEHPELRLPRTFHWLRYSTSVLISGAATTRD